MMRLHVPVRKNTMKFNGYQETAILNKLASTLPQLDSKELWYGYIQPFFNEREVNPSGALQLASSRDELQQILRVLAVDFVLRKIKQLSSSPEQELYLMENMPVEALQEVARLMGNAINASIVAIRETPMSG